MVAATASPAMPATTSEPMVSARNGCTLNRVISTTISGDADQRRHDQAGPEAGGAAAAWASMRAVMVRLPCRGRRRTNGGDDSGRGAGDEVVHGQVEGECDAGLVVLQRLQGWELRLHETGGHEVSGPSGHPAGDDLSAACQVHERLLQAGLPQHVPVPGVWRPSS